MTEAVILHKEQTGSTMDDARRAIRDGAGEWTVCTAGSQSAGRGRVPGRQWEDEGASLLFTLVIRRDRYLPDYPPTQMMALALCRYLMQHHGLDPRIKWPNDVLLDGRKLAGILVEAEGPYFLAGMGLNLNQKFFSPGLRRPAVSLATALAEKERDESLSPDTELPLILDQVRGQLSCPADIGEITGYIGTLGREVTVDLGNPARHETLTGTVMGLKEDGALLVRDDSGVIRTVYSGEMAENS